MKYLNILYIFLCVIFLGCTATPKDEEPSEAVAEAITYYKQATKYDRAWQMRLAEMNYRKAYEIMQEDPSQDWVLYADAGYRYAYLLNQRGDTERAITVATDILAEDIQPSERSALLMLMAQCQRGMGQYDEAKKSFAKAYEAQVEDAGGESKGVFNMIVTCYSLYLSYMELEDYDEAARWLKRMEEEFAAYEQADIAKPALIEEYKGHLAINRARLLLAKGHVQEANAIYNAIPDSRFGNLISITYAANYLMDAGRYAEAADMYARLDTTPYAIDSARITFDVINERIASRYIANMKAGRTQEALSLGAYICDVLDSALVRQKRSDMAELTVIYQTHEKELALNKAQAETQLHRILLAAALIVILLIGWLLSRTYRYNKVLTEKNSQLYKQIQHQEQAEAEERERQQAQPADTLSQNQRLYNHLCELMKDPKVYTDAEANHETLARLVGSNRTYVYEALHECAGMTPADFINQYRIRHAALLLTTTDDPVGLIIEQSGITNRSTFSRLFGEHYSMSPTEFRKASKHLK